MTVFDTRGATWERIGQVTQPCSHKRMNSIDSKKKKKL